MSPSTTEPETEWLFYKGEPVEPDFIHDVVTIDTSQEKATTVNDDTDRSTRQWQLALVFAGLMLAAHVLMQLAA